MSERYSDLKTRTIVEANDTLPRHSEASIIELSDGSLLMAWQRHEKSSFGGGDQAPSTISLMNSYDKGETWTNERIVAKMIEGCVNVYSPSLFRRKDNGLSLFFKRYTHLVYREQILSSYYRIDSYDEGKTWTEEKTFWENEPYSPVNDSVKRLSSGAALLPVSEPKGGWCDPGEKTSVFVLRSEDDMDTYTKSNVLSVPMRGLMEPCVAQRPDGTVDMVMRTQLGSVFHSESHDDGGTWSKPQTTGLRSPESCSCIARVPGCDLMMVVWNNSEYDMHWASHYGKRTPLTIALSDDGLKTFKDLIDIETDPDRAFTNPDVMFTSDGTCLINYWSCPYKPGGYMGGYRELKLASLKINI